QRRGPLGGGKAVAGHDDAAEDLVLRVDEVRVGRGHHGHAQFLGQRYDGPVDVPQAFFVLHRAVVDQEAVVAQRLDLQVIVKAGDVQQALARLSFENGLEQLARLARGADNEALAALFDFGPGNPRMAVEMVQVGQRHQLVQVPQARLVGGQDDDVVRAAPLVAVVDQIAFDSVNELDARGFGRRVRVGKRVDDA